MADRYNIRKITRDQFPWFWQTDTNLALIDVVMGSLAYLNEEYAAFETDTKQKVGYSIQRLSLEQSLNERFDSDLNRIEVTNNKSGNDEFIFNEAETEPIAPKYIFNEGEVLPGPATETYIFNESENVSVSATGFTVYAPASLTGQDAQLKAWIERVRIVGTSFQIIYI